MIDETGNRYGRLTVLRRYGSDAKGIIWLCHCDCGKDIAVHGTLLRNGTSRSCGCYRNMSREQRKETGLRPYSYLPRTGGDSVVERLQRELRDCRNELCLKCGDYKQRHLGACDGCRWREV